MSDGIPRTPYAFEHYAYQTTVESYASKALLTALGRMADNQTGRCEAKVETLMQMTGLAERTVQLHLNKLRDAGVIAIRPQYRRNGSQRNNEYLLLASFVTEWPDGEPVERIAGGCTTRTPPVQGTHPLGVHDTHPGGARHAPPELKSGSAIASPHAASEGNGEAGSETKKERKPSAQARKARAREAAEKLPIGFPDELRPHAEQVHRVLTEVAEQWNAREVTLRGVGLAIMGEGQRRYVSEAYALASWAATAPRDIKDVVGTYRTWLKRADRIAGVEKLGAAVDADAPIVRGAGRRPTRFEEAQAGLAAEYERLRAEGR